MKIQILGYIIIPLAIFLYFKNIKYILYLTIFLAGFTSSSIINIGGSFSVQPAYFTGTIFILKSIFLINKKKLFIKPDNFLSLFITVSILSLIMPTLIISKKIFIMNQKSIITNIFFTSSNITQLFYILFCFVLYVCIKNYLYYNPLEIKKFIKILIYSTAFICLLGFYQEFAFINHLEFDKIFRSGIHGNTQGGIGFVRVYSVAQEPSMLAYFLVPMLSLTISLNKDIIASKTKVVFILLILLTAILSTSTTFFVGLAALLVKIFFDKLLLLIKNITSEKEKLGYIFPVIFILLIAACIVIININPIIKNVLLNGSYNKFLGNNESGKERSSIFLLHINAFLNYPFLGVGFGTARGKDLFSTWLCNVGFIGLGLFLIYLYRIITKLKTISRISYGISNYIFVLFICAFTSVPEPYNLFIWIMLGMAEILIQKEFNAK